MKSLLPFSPIFQMYFIKRKKTERPTSPSWQATGGRSPGCRRTAWTGWTSKESPGRPLLEQRRSSRMSHEQDPPLKAGLWSRAQHAYLPSPRQHAFGVPLPALSPHRGGRDKHRLLSSPLLLPDPEGFYT